MDLQLLVSGLPVQALEFSSQAVLELEKQVSGVDEDSLFSKSLYFHWNDDDSLVTHDAEERRTNYEGGGFRGTALIDAQRQRQRIARSKQATRSTSSCVSGVTWTSPITILDTKTMDLV